MAGGVLPPRAHPSPAGRGSSPASRQAGREIPACGISGAAPCAPGTSPAARRLAPAPRPHSPPPALSPPIPISTAGPGRAPSEDYGPQQPLGAAVPAPGSRPSQRRPRPHHGRAPCALNPPWCALNPRGTAAMCALDPSMCLIHVLSLS